MTFKLQRGYRSVHLGLGTRLDTYIYIYMSYSHVNAPIYGHGPTV